MEVNPPWGKKQILMAISWAGGIFGADRFYQQQIGWGILKLLTFGGLYVWWLVDAIRYTVEAGKE